MQFETTNNDDPQWWLTMMTHNDGWLQVMTTVRVDIRTTHVELYLLREICMHDFGPKSGANYTRSPEQVLQPPAGLHAAAQRDQFLEYVTPTHRDNTCYWWWWMFSSKWWISDGFLAQTDAFSPGPAHLFMTDPWYEPARATIDNFYLTHLTAIVGCTDSAACNFDITAGVDDGSCVIPGDCLSTEKWDSKWLSACRSS